MRLHVGLSIANASFYTTFLLLQEYPVNLILRTSLCRSSSEIPVESVTDVLVTCGDTMPCRISPTDLTRVSPLTYIYLTSSHFLSDFHSTETLLLIFGGIAFPVAFIARDSEFGAPHLTGICL